MRLGTRRAARSANAAPGGAYGRQPEGPPRRRFALPAAVAALVVAVVVAVIAVLVVRGSDGGTSSAPAVRTSTAQVERRDLLETESFDGTLGYRGARAVVYLAPGGSGQSGAASLASRDGGASSELATLVATTAEEAATALLAAYSAPASTTDDVPILDGTSTQPADTGTAPETTSPEAETGAAAETAPSEESGAGAAGEAPATGSGTSESQGGAASGEVPTGEASGSESGGASQPATEQQTPQITIPQGASAAASSSAAAAGVQSGASGGSSASQARVVTSLPREGAILEPGSVLYRVNRRPTVLMDGTTPAYRTLRKGVADGPDVRQLEENLRTLGLDPRHDMTIDQHFGSATKAAVERWQRALGVDDTGVVKLGAVVFQPGTRRVATREVEVGDVISSGQTVLMTSSTRQVVTVDLEVADLDLVAEGDTVRVELPDGRDVPGTVSSIGRVVETADSSAGTSGATAGQQGSSSGTTTVEVTIRLSRRADVDLDAAPVDVGLTTQAAEDVLAVPVTALLALAGGGYAVEVVDGPGQTHLVRVEPGLYADGYVEVGGEGIADGTTVVVPAT